MRHLIAIAVLLTLARDACAHPHQVGVLDSLRARAGGQPAEPARDLPSPVGAQWIAVGATAIPLGLGLAAAGMSEAGGSPAPGLVLGGLGVVLGPVAGYAYGGVGPHALPGVLLRGAFVGGTAVTAGQALGGVIEGGGTAIVVLSVAFLAATTIAYAVDVAHLGSTVREHNENAATMRAIGWRVSGGGSPALAVEVRF